ncbi:MAG: ImmA/IrrE family metallo-endopeptidase [Chloroflexi bacterium]|nr:ImmA/IrrE family metallo-endopeptidase [Chloroflexota bacterium]
MKTGTPGFVGARLREAREARGLTAISLAELLRVTRSAVSYYETGATSPQPEVMERMVSVLNVKPDFFFRPVAEGEDIEPVFYRSMASATKEARLRGQRRYRWLKEIVAYLRQYVSLPRVNFPGLDVGDKWKTLSPTDIEIAATDVRRFWRLGDGPISDVMLLAENNGAIATRLEMGTAALDAFSAWDAKDRAPYVVLGSDKNASVRSRYDLAHELGHLVLHNNVDRSRLSSSVDFKLIEEQAHRFAGAFLVPAETFSADVFVPSLDAFRALKTKWRTSIGMMIHRAQDLGLVGGDQAQKLWISYNRRGWRTNEPLDDKLPVEEPRVLRRAFEVLIDAGIQSRAQITSRFPFSTNDVEELAGLPHGFLDEDSPYVWAITTLGKR